MMHTLLVADDNRLSRELLCEVLDSGDYRVIEARHGKEALERMAETAPDLVLLDLEMPVKDGFAVLDEMRRDARYCRIPVIAVTAKVLRPDRERIAAAGFDACVAKPIDNTELRARVSELLQSGRRGSIA